MRIPSGMSSSPHRLTCPLCERSLLDLLGTGFARCGRCGLPLFGSALETLRDIIGFPPQALEGPEEGPLGTEGASRVRHRLTSRHRDRSGRQAGHGHRSRLPPRDRSAGTHHRLMRLAGLSEEDRAAVERARALTDAGSGYLKLQSNRPKTIAYSLTDSPVGQLAWIVENFKEWTDETAELPEEAVDLDQLLTNVSVYWFTGTGASAANFLYETGHSTEWGSPGTAPQGWALFAAQPFVGAMLDPDHEIGHWSEFDRGGHFAAMETPDLLVGDVRRFFRTLR